MSLASLGSDATGKIRRKDIVAGKLSSLCANPKVELGILLLSGIVAVVSVGIFDDYEMKSAEAARFGGLEQKIHASTSGVVTRILVKPHQFVEVGQALLQITMRDSRKPDVTIRSPNRGTVDGITVQLGQEIVAGETVLKLDQ